MEDLGGTDDYNGINDLNPIPDEPSDFSIVNNIYIHSLPNLDSIKTINKVTSLF